MAQIIVTDRGGDSHVFQAESGLSLMQNLKDQGLDIAAICGGCCSCATCHVHVDPAWIVAVGAPAADELELMQDSAHFRPGPSRLSCQIRVDEKLDGLRVTLAPED